MNGNTVSAKMIYTKLREKEGQIKDYRILKTAYHVLKNYRSDRCSLFSMYHKLRGKEVDREPFNKIAHGFKKSIESLFYLSTDTPHPSVVYGEGKEKLLNDLSTESWPQFCNKLDGEVYISIGFRKAFNSHNPLPLHHAVILVSNGKDQHALFCFNSKNVNGLYLKNDLFNKVSRHYTFYDELTIRGNCKQLRSLFTQIEKYSTQMHFNILKTNCYTPLLFGLSKAASFGFALPEKYKERLLIVLAKENNQGAGMITNKDLKHPTERACEHILHPKLRL